MRLCERLVERIEHPALAGAPGLPPESASVTDRQRIGILLQAAALLAHLQSARWTLADGWSGAVVDADGWLRAVRVAPGVAVAGAQSPLRELARRLFRTEAGIDGRGQGRRVARALLGRWEQDLRPLSGDDAVDQILSIATFLWQRDVATLPTVLTATVSVDGQPERWIAGAPWVARRLRGREGAPPRWRQLQAAGRWRETCRAWTGTLPKAAADRLRLAEALVAIGRYESAQRCVDGLASVEAEAVRIRSLCHSGALVAATRRLSRLRPEELDGGLRIELAEIALRAFANLGRPQRAEPWVESCRRLDGEAARLRGRLLVALAAWDRGDTDRLAGELEAAAAARERPDLAWRWHQAEGLLAMARDDGAGVVASLERALVARRRLRPIDAARLWNDMMVGRAALDDWRGAERACLHGLRLLREAEGAKLTTLFLFNLAEIRLRRGSTRGVREALERATELNRLASNLRGAAHDVALWARFHLASGEPQAAIDCLAVMERALEHAGVDWNRDERRTLAARALGLLGRSAAARRELTAIGMPDCPALDAEERPAVWWTAGDRARAHEVAVGPTAMLWRALLAGPVATELWRALDELPEHRAARMVYDIERLAPGVAPPAWLARAAVRLREAGAIGWADRLESARGGLWRTLRLFLEAARPATPASLSELFERAGCSGARLRYTAGGRDEVLVAGAGGDATASLPIGRAELVLRYREVGDRERALLRLVATALAPPSGDPATPSSAVREAAPAHGEILGDSPALRAAIARVDKLAVSRLPVLILGETGTGKELFARRLHRRSERAERRFLPVNCAALSDTLLLSELFGHVRGAFTGAERDRAGVFETARGGTVFLDEIGDLPLDAQGVLLRVLQEGEVRRVGESTARPVDVRVVAATHRDLVARTERGAFRADLYYRLRVGQVELPPLRRRGADVETLAAHFLAMHGLELADGARRLLVSYRWPGNVRELQNVLAVAAAICEGPCVDAGDLELEGDAPSDDLSSYHQQVTEFRRRLVADAVAASGGNRSQAAKRLGLSRQALSYLVRQLGIT